MCILPVGSETRGHMVGSVQWYKGCITVGMPHFPIGQSAICPDKAEKFVSQIRQVPNCSQLYYVLLVSYCIIPSFLSPLLSVAKRFHKSQ